MDTGAPAGVDVGGPAGVDAGGPVGVDAGGPAGVGRDSGGPAGVDAGGPLAPASLLPSEATAEIAWALSIPVLEGSVARLTIVSFLAVALVLLVESAVVVAESSVTGSEPPRVAGCSSL